MGITQGFNGTSKMVLKIELKGTSSVKMELVSINTKYVRKLKTNDFCFFEDEENAFVIWSTQDFVFNERQIRIPDTEHLSNDMSWSHDFKQDDKRYIALKKMYTTLQKWSTEMDDRILTFVSNGARLRKKIVIVDNYWFVT